MPLFPTLYNDCSHIEDVHLLFCEHFMNIFSILGVLTLDIFPSEIISWCLVCVIINSKVSKGAKIRNRYNQVPHLTQDTNGKVTNSIIYLG